MLRPPEPFRVVSRSDRKQAGRRVGTSSSESLQSWDPTTCGLAGRPQVHQGPQTPLPQPHISHP